jgi:pSer/pThr/pTyr-binding forkhead associated (FHA) protein
MMPKLPNILRLRLIWNDPAALLAFTVSLEAQQKAQARPGKQASEASPVETAHLPLESKPAPSAKTSDPPARLVDDNRERPHAYAEIMEGGINPALQPERSMKERAAPIFNLPGEAQTPTAPPKFPPALFAQKQISVEALKQTGIPIEETTYLAIGGGLGSFTWVDHLVIHGVDPGQIRAIGFEEKPYARFRRLCRNSQIPDDERLRSDSGATPDNIWGWPGYALREIWADLKQGNLRHAAYLAWQIFSEPVLAEPFTPKAGQLFETVEREAKRIGWDKIWRFGRVRAIRKTDDGRYAIAYSQTTVRKYRPRFMIANYVHLAVGYPRLHFLPDLQSYRAQTGDIGRFVNAYEPHDHIYHHLRRHGGVVLIRGRGIVASRIIQRLHEERLKNPNITILHLMRYRRPVGSRYERARRLSEHHFTLQPYNFPKASFGGDLALVMAQADDSERSELIDAWGGSTTAKRRDWQVILDNGLSQGWYQPRFGHLARVERNSDDRLVILIRTPGRFQEETRLCVDFIIDATGLDAYPDQSPLLSDLLQMYQLQRNAKGRLKVNPYFELVGMENGPGRLYASGIMTLGGPFAPVDSFVGLQYAAQCSLEGLMASGAPGLRSLTPIRSMVQWLRWARGARP